MRCFVCNPALLDRRSEKAPQWLPITTACRKHAQEATLADGRNVNSELNSVWRTWDGGLVSYFFDPVAIRQHRGWIGWEAGEWVIYGDPFESETFGEFFLQSDPRFVDVLYAIHGQKIEVVQGSARTVDQDRRLLSQFFTTLARSGVGQTDIADRMLGRLWLQRSVSQLIPESAEASRITPELVRRVAEQVQSSFPPEFVIDGIVDLVRLASFRFRLLS